MPNSLNVATVVAALGLLPGCAHQYERWHPFEDSPNWEAVYREGIDTFYNELRIRGASTTEADYEHLAIENSFRLSAMFREEVERIVASGRSPAIGLALSGGGIRSAAFSIGVLKGLHEAEVLEHIGYLSTVSGGGYAGAWLVAQSDGLRESTDEVLRPGSPHLRHVSQHGSYLFGGNWSKSTTAAIYHGLLHVIGIPTIWLFNFVYDVQINWTSEMRKVYRNAVSSAFLYDTPLVSSSRSRTDIIRKQAVREVERRFAGIAPSVGSVLAAVTDALAWAFFLVVFDAPDAAKIGLMPWRTVDEIAGWFGASGDIYDRGISSNSDSIISLFAPTESAPRPFWIANMHLSLTDDSDSVATKNRSGDAFEVTPLRAGSDSIGYVRVPADPHPLHTASDHFWMRTGFVAAISGAAVDSESLRHGLITSTALKVSGLDLGYWIDGWSYGWNEGDGFCHNLFKSSVWAVESLAPIWLLTSVFWDGSPHLKTRSAKCHLLTDGGHFDNLGIYALVKRGCRLIIVADATADPLANDWRSLSRQDRSRAFADLRATEAKLLTDFGVSMRMDWSQFDPRGATPKLLLTGRIERFPVLYAFAKEDEGATHVADEVTILYLKCAYRIGGQPRSEDTFVDWQKALDDEFPNRTTTDQEYSELEMTSLIQLGYRAVEHNRERLGREVKKAVTTWSAPPGSESDDWRNVTYR